MKAKKFPRNAGFFFGDFLFFPLDIPMENVAGARRSTRRCSKPAPTSPPGFILRHLTQWQL